jgi:hypothetical protein
MPPILDGTADYGSWQTSRQSVFSRCLSSTPFRVGVLLAVMWLELLAGWVLA